MFTAQKTIFIYAISPVHMGAGTALGLIDNPIQREKHTDHPMVAGSGLKGAVRHHFWAQSPEQRDKLNRYFGPETSASDYAGAISFSDAQLVAFPVRCTKAGFVYATSPLALARAQRLLAATGTKAEWKVPVVAGSQCKVNNDGLLANGKLLVDAYELKAEKDTNLQVIADWLANHALPAGDGYEFFRNKLKTDLVLMCDDDFGYFVKNSTLVEPHVRIKNETGTAESGGLFYTENLPPESLLVSVVLASDERSKQAEKAKAETILADVLNGTDGFGGLHGKLLQIGGDATTGRGQVVVTAVEV